MKIHLVQTVLSPYRLELFRLLAATPGVSFTLLLLSDRFLVRPKWKRDVHSLPFRVLVPFSISRKIGEEKEFVVNPFLLFTLLRERPDVVICGGFNVATIMAWLYSLLTGAKYVIWTEATLHTDGKASPLRLGLRRILAKRASAFIDAGTLAREYVRYLLPGLPDSRLFRAYNCVDTAHFRNRTNVDPGFFKSRGFPEHNLVFVGALNERKGIPALLKVYHAVLKRVPFRVGLLLIGEGPLRPDIEKFQTDNKLADLHLEGWVKNEDTAKYYGLADAFVLLSLVDHNPLVLLEALASGIPIVCSSGACNAIDFIESDVNGFIVDPTRIDAIAERVIQVLGWDKAKRDRCAAAAARLSDTANYPDAAAAFLAAARSALPKQS